MAWVGSAASAPAADRRVDVGGRAVVPGFVDSHSHLVFAGDRAAEFTARMAGTPYDGGGIGVSVAATRAASDDELRALLRARVTEMRRLGTTTVEVKSGYGLTTADEERSVRLAREVTEETTFLGAHVVPPEARRRPPGLPRPRDRPHARRLRAARPVGRRVLRALGTAGVHRGRGPPGARWPGGMPGSGCASTGTSCRPGPECASRSSWGRRASTTARTSHRADVEALSSAAGTTVATLLPGVEFSTRSPYPDARALLDAGVDLALATDCNPGTCNTASMPFVLALAVRELRMTAAEALVAATVGGRSGAAAVRRGAGGRGVAGRPRGPRGAVVRAPRLPAGDAARSGAGPPLRPGAADHAGEIGAHAVIAARGSILGVRRAPSRSARGGGRPTWRSTPRPCVS